MIRRTWLDLADPAPRRILVTVTLGSLLVGTLLLEQLHLTVVQIDLISLAWLGGLAMLWSLLRWRTEPRVRARRMGERSRREQALRQRGFLVGGAVDDGRGGIDSLADRDPAFSEPALADRVRRLLEAHWAGDARADAWIRCSVPDALHLVDVRCVSVSHRPGVVRCTLSAHGPATDGDGDRTLRIHLERPAAASSDEPDELARLDEKAGSNDWYVVSVDTVPSEALPLSTVAEELDAHVRALVGRDPDFDPAALRRRALAVVEGLDDADAAGLAAMCTPGMSHAATALRGSLGEGSLPEPLDLDQVRLVDVGADGWFDLAELSCGQVGLAFLRPSGESEAPWLLWRAWRGGAA